MTENAQDGSEDFETKTYAEIAALKETGSPAEDQEPSGTEATDDETAAVEPTPTSDSQPKTLEESQALLEKYRKEAEHAQELVGRQGNELGEIRKEIAEIKSGYKQEPAKESEPESYVAVFKREETWKGMDDGSKEYLGHAFDLLEKRLQEKLLKAPEIEHIRQSVTSRELESVQKGWEQEAQELIDTYGQELVNKHGPKIQESMTEAIKSGADPKTISVKRYFRDLAFDDVAVAKKPDPKDTLNEAARKKATSRAPATSSKTDYSSMSNKDAFAALLKETGGQ